MVTVFNSMTFALKVTPFSVKSLSEASVAVDRFKVSGSLLLHVRSHPGQNCYLNSHRPHRLAALGFCSPSAVWQVSKKGGSGGGCVKGQN